MQIKKFQTVLLALTTAVGVQAQSGGYYSSCSQTGLDKMGQLMTAECVRADQTSGPTSLDLNNCFANIGGLVIYRKGGGFGATCPVIEQTETFGSTIQITCGNGRGGQDTNFIDLNAWVGNINGQLVC